MNNISAFVKYQRKILGLTQEELAAKAGVGLRFIREMEKGKATLQLDKVGQVLNLFGFQLSPSKQLIDAYTIYWKYINKPIKITLTNKLKKYGIFIKEIIDKKENKITAWQFVSNRNTINHPQKPDEKFIEIIIHSDIQKIEDQ